MKRCAASRGVSSEAMKQRIRIIADVLQDIRMLKNKPNLHETMFQIHDVAVGNDALNDVVFIDNRYRPETVT